MKIEKILVIILLTVLFGFNIFLLVSNRNNKATVKLYQQEVNKLSNYKREDFLRKKAFEMSINNKHLLTTLNETEKQLLKDKRLVVYVPQNACGICLEKLFNRYWDNYISRFSEQVIVFYENPHLNNVYYIAEKLVACQEIKEHKFGNDDLITIFFLDENQMLLNLYLFDVNSLELIEPYIKSFYNIFENKK